MIIKRASAKSCSTNVVLKSSFLAVVKILLKESCIVDRSGALSQFFMKKNTLIFFYTCFYVKIIKNNQKFHILKNAKNCKLQINQKFNLLKNAKNQKSQKETKINTMKNY